MYVPRLRRSIRKRSFDYSTPGYYFFTTKTNFGRPVLEEERFRQVIVEVWSDLPKLFPHVALDSFVVMPNHVHGLVLITDESALAGVRLPGLPRIVGALKSISSKRVNEVRGTPGSPLWQISYWDRIVSNERSLDPIRTYIASNPLNWEADPENPSGLARYSEEEYLDRMIREDRLVLAGEP